MHANYVLAENGKWRLFYKRFGAPTLIPDLIGGPEAATRFVSAQSECESWRTEIWCEAAALIDHDRQRALATMEAAPHLMIDRGVGLLDLLPKEARRPSLTRTPLLGIHLDVTDRTAGVWTGMVVFGELERALERGRGWQWELWDNRYEEQLRQAAGAVTWPDPDVAAALDALSTKVEAQPLTAAEQAHVQAAIAELRG